jgi:enolase-phosphatase E1
MSKKLYLFDIEGTTTDINFVHKVLFPYAHQNLSSFILNNQTNPVVSKAIEDTRVIVRNEEGFTPSLYQCIDKLLLLLIYLHP